ncbi:MAG: DUF11 domain-containing protein [Methanomicrobiales archaeon]|nr:DUF11 domain-containing protein [Methanomicrobiales archaeon]
MGVLLLVVIALWAGAVSTVQAQDTGEEAQANLVLTKMLTTEEPVYAGDEVEWEIKLENTVEGTTAKNIVVTDVLGDLLTLVNADPSTGTCMAGLSWSIPDLAGGQFAKLRLTTSVAEDAVKGDEVKNCVTLDSQPEVCASTTVAGTSTTSTVTVKPETLNLKSGGFFTVFVHIDGYALSEIDLKESSLTCNEAVAKRLKSSQKDGGTVIAKFRRQELSDEMTAGEDVEIACEGIISVGDETVKVKGMDTVRVIGEKKKGFDRFLCDIMDTVLPDVGDDGDEGAGDQTPTTAEPTPTPTDSLNRGQLKKAERTGNTVCTENCDGADSQGTRGNGKKSGTDDGGSVTGSDGKGNQGKGNDNPADTGNGKGNGNKPENENGNDKNKK